MKRILLAVLGFSLAACGDIQTPVTPEIGQEETHPVMSVSSGPDLELLQTVGVAAVQNLINKLDALLLDGIVNEGQANSMYQKLDNAMKSVANDKPSATNQLQALINEVEGYINGGNLSSVEGQSLIVSANNIIGWLNGDGTCPICGGTVCIPPCPNADYE